MYRFSQKCSLVEKVECEIRLKKVSKKRIYSEAKVSKRNRGKLQEMIVVILIINFFFLSKYSINKMDYARTMKYN